MEAVYSLGGADALFDPLRRAYLFHGDDDVAKAEALDRLQRAAVDPSFADLDWEVKDATSSTATDVMAAASLAPFASPVRVVVLRRAEVLRRKERTADAETLAGGIARMPASSCLVLLAAADDEDRGRVKTVLTTKLDAAVRSVGALVKFAPLGDEDMCAWVEGLAAAAGKRISPGAADVVISAGRGDRRVIANEVEKAICFAGDKGAISIADAEAVASHDPEDVMFRLVDAISARTPDRALGLLHEILRYDAKPQSVAGRLLALMSRQLRLLVQASALARQGVDPSKLRALPPELVADLPVEASIVPMAWKARDLFRVSRGWNDNALAAAFQSIMDCDLANKGGGGSEDVVTNLELMVVRLCRSG